MEKVTLITISLHTMGIGNVALKEKDGCPLLLY